MKSPTRGEVQTPVLIVGGGGAGLTASMLLSQLGVESLLVSALPTTSILPKAHVLNQRAMEILDEVGVAEKVYRRGTPLENMRATAWYAGLTGPDPICGRKIGQLDAWGAGYTDTDWVAASPCPSTNLPQIRLEPILKEHAEAMALGEIRFHHEVVGLEQKDDDAVVATVVDHERGESYEVRARYVLACDGGRTINQLIGVNMEGQRALMNAVSIHMSADLSRWAKDPEVLIRWLIAPSTGAFAVLVPMGPDRWGPDSEEWVFHLNYQHEDTRALDDTEVERDMRDSLGIGDHSVEIHKISRWSLEGVVASRFQVGRTFVLGDAAHRHPPTGGLGLNSAIQDAHNLCWKIASVLQGQAGPALLSTYEAERRPVVARNVERSVENAMNQMRIIEILGLEANASRQERLKQLSRLWDESSGNAQHRREVHRAIASQSMEFREHNIECGYTYESDATVDDGSVRPEPIDPIHVYEPSTRPGCPLPHAWVERQDGGRLAMKELVRPGRFLLIAGEQGSSWCDAAANIAEHSGLPIDAVKIGHLDGDLLDPQCHWMQQRQIRPGGAILVRPDRFVAWRSLGAADEPLPALQSAIDRILDRAAVQ